MAIKEKQAQEEMTGAVVGAGVGAVAGASGAVAAVAASGSVAGLGAAGITSGLATVGGVVGGGMLSGLVITAAAPVVAAAALGYGGYKLTQWYRSKNTAGAA